jgi:hypothetical protein
MVKKKSKRKPFRAVTAVKAMAREQVGTPPVSRVVPNKKRTNAAQKHKPTLEKMLEELQ